MNNSEKERDVAEDTVGDFWVSTIRLSIDHGSSFGRPPLWYETMVFRQKDGEVTSWSDLYCNRYTTEDEARAGHNRVVEKLAAGTLGLYGIEA